MERGGRRLQRGTLGNRGAQVGRGARPLRREVPTRRVGSWLRRRLAAAVLVIAFTGSASASDPETGTVAPELAAALDGVLGRPALADARLGILVVRRDDGAVLFARDPDRGLIPASNMKVLTAIAALDAYGPAHRFATSIRAAAPPDEQGVVAAIAVRGAGDPVLNSEDWWRLAADLRRAGVRRVSGDILLDDTAFDAEYWHPDWGRVSARAYHAPVSALTANYGAYFVNVIPGDAPGEDVRVEVDPPISYLKVENAATTGSARAKRTLVVGRASREAGGETVRVSGRVRAGDPADTFPRSVLDATLYAGAVFRHQLESNGIEVGGQVIRGDASSLPHELLAYEGRPLIEIVRLFMKYSNNSVAESLVKGMALASGQQGSWRHGLAAVRDRLVRLGVPMEGVVMVDGSGLSPRNRLSARVLVEALRIADASFAFGPELMVSLPIAATDGTLEKRARGARGQVRGKTGLLSDQRTTSLSGHAVLADGERVVFSFIVNGYRGGSHAGMDALDAWLATLVSSRIE